MAKIKSINSKIIVFLCFFMFLIISNPHFAGPVKDADNALDEAQAKYYRATTDNPKMSPQEKAKLRKQTIMPAIKNLNKAEKQTKDKVFGKYIKKEDTKTKQQAIAPVSTAPGAPSNQDGISPSRTKSKKRSQLKRVDETLDPNAKQKVFNIDFPSKK